MKRSVTLWKLLELIPLWIIGGTVYYLIEFFWRGQSHWTMFLLGGVLFVLIGLMNEVLPFRFPLVLLGGAGAALVTLAELLVGMVVNRYLGWGVWDYSDLPFQFQGQICLYYSLLWVPLSMAAVVLDDELRFLLGEKRRKHPMF